MINYFYYAQTADTVALLFDEIVAAKALTADNYTVVAALTKAIYTRTERNRLRDEIRSAIAEALDISEENIIVSFDTELYRKLSSDNINADEIINLAKQRN